VAADTARRSAIPPANPRDFATASLLWAACRIPPDLATAEEALAGGADLIRAANAAIGHRVSGLLWRAAADLVDRDGMPLAGGEWAVELRNDAKRTHARSLMLLPRLGAELLAPLVDAGVAPIVFKGPALVGRYPYPGLRPMDDVDLLVPPDQHPEARAALAKAGWTVVPWEGDPDHELILVHPALPGLPVEVHEDLSPPGERAGRLSITDLWRERRQVSLAGVEVYGLPPELELVALADHAAKPFHTYERMIWSVDLALVCRERLDWARVEALADAARLRSALAVGLTHAAYLGAEVPSALVVPPARGSRRVALEPLLSPTWPLFELDGAQRNRFAFALMDDPRLRFHRFWSQAAADGLARLPKRISEMGWRAGRRWWSLRSDRRGASKSPPPAPHLTPLPGPRPTWRPPGS
jgi:hypothetical protein